jgi:hypothetical protein
MSIIDTIIKNCTQTAVYWGNPVNDGYGGFTYDVPVEIDCRWEDKNEIFVASDGDEVVAKSVVYVIQAVENEGCLYLGTLDSIMDSLESSGSLINPIGMLNVYRIRRVDRVPKLGSTTEFLRKAFLTSKNMV